MLGLNDKLVDIQVGFSIPSRLCCAISAMIYCFIPDSVDLRSWNGAFSFLSCKGRHGMRRKRRDRTSLFSMMLKRVTECSHNQRTDKVPRDDSEQHPEQRQRTSCIALKVTAFYSSIPKKTSSKVNESHIGSFSDDTVHRSGTF